ncbi:uncharacterized protein BJ212DRAFT_1482159 [Suillus subaureus]|uniref:Uncharacterized protein n=1 Tax=Suillus subaureus TaxID=48587 RepID=A0A9P7JCL1_9AGAM|nr:uncharacterized protein BJ212DRAFT_1482159 [Suillus subaureus]KAG1814428.1 hypothetical protein BJ212DRAFT_1482159 [Suillus subaureus]
MSPQSAIRFNDPPVTNYNSMDVDESTVSWASLDNLYLGLDDDIEYDSLSSESLDVLAAIPDQSPPAQADHPCFLIDPDLYLRPEDDIIDVDELLDSADPKIDVPAASEVSMSLDDTSNKLQSEQPELTNKDLHLMAQEFQPFGSYEHTGLQSIQDRLGDYKHHTGDLPDPSIPLLLEAEQPFWMAWAETSDKLRRADADLQRLQRAQQMSIEMLKVVDSLINRFEDQIQM